MVPDLKHNTLLSGSKFADAGYVTVLTRDAIHIYDGDSYVNGATKDAVLRGWRDEGTGLWRVPLEPNTPPLKSDYLLLPKDTEEQIANVYELPSTA